MKLEMIWIIIGICGFLSQLGGSDYAPKMLRRIIISLVMFLAIWYFKGFSWVLIPLAVTQWAVYTLPFTLIGNGIPEHWFNWVWVWIWGVLLCVSSLWLNVAVWPAVLICGLVLGLLAILSNVKAVANWFQWKLIEFFIGVCPAICVCLSVTI